MGWKWIEVNGVGRLLGPDSAGQWKSMQWVCLSVFSTEIPDLTMLCRFLDHREQISLMFSRHKIIAHPCSAFFQGMLPSGVWDFVMDEVEAVMRRLGESAVHEYLDLLTAQAGMAGLDAFVGLREAYKTGDSRKKELCWAIIDAL